MPLILALDQSTSATKALLFETDGRVVDRESRDHAQHYPRPGWVEHDAEEIWQNTLAVAGQVLGRQQSRQGEIAAVSLTNQRETIVVFDRSTGRPLHPAIVWQCRRGDEVCREHLAAGREELIHEKTGLTIDAYFSASKLQWLVRNNPVIRARLRDGSALIGTIDAYLIYRLTEGRVFATDTTNASRTLLFDIKRLAWDEELCAVWDVQMAALPEVRAASARFGSTDFAGQLSVPLPICGVIGDSQASLFAHRCFSAGDVKVTFGTGSSLLVNIGPAPRFSPKGVLIAIAWTHGETTTYAMEGIVIASASTLIWLRDQLGLARDVPEIEQLALQVPDSAGVHLVPAFTGLGLPYWNAEARAAITGLTPLTDRRHIARAGFESIALQIGEALAAIQAEVGTTIETLHGDGGPTASRFLMQLTADLTGAPLRASQNPNFSPLGAAWLGALGIGAVKAPADLLAMPRDEGRFTPSADAVWRDARFAAWRRAVRQTCA